MKKIFPIYLALFLVFSCSDNDDNRCPEEMKLDKDELSDLALSFNPYSSDATAAVFLDQDNKEYKFNIERNFIKTSTNFISGFCYDGEYYKLYLRGVDLNLFFHIWISDVPKPNAENTNGESLLVLVSENEDLSFGETSLYHSINIVNDSGLPFDKDQSVTLDSLELNGNIYLNVIENNSADFDPRYKTYYNTDSGLVGFTDSLTNNIFNLDRIE